MKTLRRMVLATLILALFGVFSAVQPAFAQETCPLQAGVAENPLATPSSSATAASGNLMGFALAARDYFNSITTSQELGYAGCLTRNEGPWKSGSTYLAA